MKCPLIFKFAIFSLELVALVLSGTHEQSGEGFEIGGVLLASQPSVKGTALPTMSNTIAGYPVTYPVLNPLNAYPVSSPSIINNLQPASGKGYIMSTIAGGAISPITTDGGLATEYSIGLPQGLAKDSFQNLYISETFGHVVRVVRATTGHAYIYAGTLNTPGSGGNGGPATNAYLFQPYGIDFSKTLDKLFIADSMNKAIRVVDSAGIISTFYSLDLMYPRGVKVDPKAEYLFITDTMNQRIIKVSLTNVADMTLFAGVRYWDSDYVGPYFDGDGGLAVNAHFKYPSQSVVDSQGNVYVADTDNNRIRKIDLSGVVTTVCGPAGLNYIAYIEIDHKDNLIIADTFGQAIKYFDPLTGVMTTIAGTGTGGRSPDNVNVDATSLPVSRPVAILADPNGDIFIADSGNSRVIKLTPIEWSAPKAPLVSPSKMPSVDVKKVPPHYAAVTVMDGKTLTKLRFFSRNQCNKVNLQNETLLMCK